MRRLWFVVVLALLAAACGGSVTDRVAEEVAGQIVEQAGGGNVDIDTSGDGDITVSLEGEDGSVVQAGGNELPDDFPFPLPDEYEVGMNVSQDGPAGSEFFAAIRVPGDEVDETAERYATWLGSEGFQVETAEYGGSGTQGWVSISAERADDGIIALVDVSLEEVANDDDGNLIYATVVSFSWAPRGG